MRRNYKMGLLSFFLVVLSAFLILILNGNVAKAIDVEKTYTGKVNVNVQINDGNYYFVDANNIKVEVDASANPDVSMFSIVICSQITGECSALDAKHRYTELNNGKAIITDVSLDWIRETHADFVLQEGVYTIKVKPEKKNCVLGFLCTPIMDVIEDEIESNRYIETNVMYKPLNSADINVNYNSVALSNIDSTLVDSPKFSISVSRSNNIYLEEVQSLSAKYCLADNNWKNITNKCYVADIISTEEGIKIDLSDKKLEGNYNLTIVATTNFNNRQFSKVVKFTYDKTSPKVSISSVDTDITKEKTFTFTVVDNSTTKTKYLVRSVNEQKPTKDEFKNYAQSNQIVVTNLSGEFILWTCTEDSSGNYTIEGSQSFILDNSAPIIEKYNHYLDFYSKKLVIQVSQVNDQIKDGITYFASIDGVNYQEYTSNLIKVDIKDLMNGEIKAYLYAKDALGNFDVESAKEIIPVIEESEIGLEIENGTDNNYYSNEVVLNIKGSDVISIKVNSFEYINNRFFCNPVMSEENPETGEKTILGYTCKFSTDGVYDVVVSNASENSNKITFVVDKDMKWIIDEKEQKIDEMFIVKVVSKGDKFYGTLPISVYDLKKDIKLVYLDKTNKYHHLSLLENEETIALNEIKGPENFELPIDVVAYQKANILKGTNEAYYLAYSVVIDRVDNNVVVETPEEPKEEEPSPVVPDSHPVGNITEKDEGFSIKDIFTFKNVLLVAIIVVVVIYVLKFFVYKKNIQTV